MSTVAPVGSSNNSSSNPTHASSSSSSQPISISDFMELLSEEMSNQDPLQPMDPTQTMTQLAQFTNLQQTSQLLQNQSVSTASSLLGAQVTVPGSGGSSPLTGTVTAVDASQVGGGGPPELVISGASTEYPVTSISQVQLNSSSSSTANSSSSGSTASSAGTSTGSSAGASTPPPSS